MLRLVEVALFLLPFGFFGLWRLLIPANGPSTRLVVGSAIALAVLAGALLWLRQEDAAPAGAAYVPARLENDRVVPAGEAPR